MEKLFVALTQAIEGTPAVAMLAAFIWGVLSILLSPCHLASIPLIVGFIDHQGRTSVKRAFLISVLFSTGILVMIGVIGAATAALGRMAGDTGSYASYFVAAIFIITGLILMEALPVSFSGPAQVGIKKRGLMAAFILGLVLGIALGPCTFAYMAPVLAMTFKAGSSNFAYGVLLLLFYGTGHCSVIVIAGTFTEIVRRYLNWNERSRGALILKKVCGILVICGGLWLIYTAP